MNKNLVHLTIMILLYVGSFAYAYIRFTNLNVVALIITELCWMYYCRERVKHQVVYIPKIEDEVVLSEYESLREF